MKNKIMGLGLLALASGLVLGTAQASTLTFVSTAETLTKDCPTTIDVMIDTEGDDVNTIDFVLLEDDSYVLNSVETDEGVFRTYTKPKAAVAKEGDYKGQNTVRVLATTASPNGFNGDGKLLSLIITPKSDNVNLSLYAIDGSEGDDTNVAVLGEDGDAMDSLKVTDPASYKAVAGECSLAAMEAIALEEPELTISAEEVEDVVEDTTALNEENIFDEAQEKNFLQANWLYLAIGLVVIVIVLAVALKPKKEAKKKK